MHVQRICFNTGHYSWLVVGDDFLPIKPIQEFIRYLELTEKSPNTIRAYAHHLKLFWEFLGSDSSSWHLISINHLARFIYWLRTQDPHVIFLSNTPKHSESTINNIITCLASFYRHHKQLGHTQVDLLETSNFGSPNRYKSLLHHVHKNKPIQKKIIFLKKTKKIPKGLSPQEIKLILEACPNIRDHFLVSLLYETGLRIGQVLGLQHEDIHSWDNIIHIVPRKNLINQARTKSNAPYPVHVSSELRLGHASVQTTLDIYAHLDHQDLKIAYDNYLLTRKNS